MRKAFIEPERLRKFAADLGRFRSDINDLTSRLSGNLNRLGDSWQDDGYREFKEHLERTKQRLSKFSDIVEQTLPKLERDAHAAEEIHKGGIPNI